MRDLCCANSDFLCFNLNFNSNILNILYLKLNTMFMCTYIHLYALVNVYYIHINEAPRLFSIYVHFIGGDTFLKL